ncbi:MAG: nucleotidyltransferase family protein [Paraglaciecola sp.]|uniref:nucleotidyltransferase family protein n=1 Tax=Paraglaciecola sp. TaxID=1920173 RepID=UPI003296E13D
MKIELILLAAGESKRFSGIKQLADIYGQPMICHCLSQYRQNGSWIPDISDGHVLLGANASVITEALPKSINKQEITTWKRGMGHTLAQGISLLATDTTHVLVGLADQVLVTRPMILGLLAKSKLFPKNIVAAKYAGNLGAPCIFPQDFFYQLSELSGEKGAKSILRQNKDKIVSVDIPEAALDIDTQQELATITR